MLSSSTSINLQSEKLDIWRQWEANAIVRRR
jgi:hypothetical protein